MAPCGRHRAPTSSRGRAAPRPPERTISPSCRLSTSRVFIRCFRRAHKVVRYPPLPRQPPSPREPCPRKGYSIYWWASSPRVPSFRTLAAPPFPTPELVPGYGSGCSPPPWELRRSSATARGNPARRERPRRRTVSAMSCPTPPVEVGTQVLLAKAPRELAEDSALLLVSHVSLR